MRRRLWSKRGVGHKTPTPSQQEEGYYSSRGTPTDRGCLYWQGCPRYAGPCGYCSTHCLCTPPVTLQP